MKKTIILAAITFASLMTLSQSGITGFQVGAQNAVKIIASPARKDIHIEKGAQINTIVTFYNESTSVFNGTLEVVDFIVISPDGKPYFIFDNKQTNKYSSRTWVNLPTKTLSIKESSSGEVNLSIKVPDNIASGSYYFALILSSATETGSKELLNSTAPKTSQAIASLISITIPGNNTEKVTIESIKAPYFLEYGPINVDISIKNEGNVHVNTQSSIMLSNFLEKSVEQKSIKAVRIFPENTRRLSTSIGSTYMFGRYKIKVNTIYSQRKSVEGSTYVWVVPWKTITIALLTFIIFLLVISQRRKKH